MIDIRKQVVYWRDSAAEDWQVANELIRAGRFRQQINVLAETNSFNIEGRYPDTLLPSPSKEETLAYLEQAQEIFNWLMSQLP